MIKIPKIIFCTIFFIICIVPILTIPIREAKGEHFPDISEKGGGINGEFTEEVDTYFEETQLLNHPLLTGLTLINEKVLKTSLEEQVIIGKDGWLFYAETVDDFIGINRLEDREINSLIKILDLINEYCDQKGSKFVFFVAPNKNTVYPEYMPYNYVRSRQESNLSRLNTAMATKEREYYIDCIQLLDKQQGNLYYKTDTHWNDVGAYMCFEAVMERLGIDYKDSIKSSLGIESFSNGDLAAMLYPYRRVSEDIMAFEGEYSFEFSSKIHSREDINITTSNSKNKGSMIVFRDSFFNNLLPYFAENMGNINFTRVFPYRLDILDEQKYDSLIIEIAERNLSDLLSNTPVMPAPMRACTYSGVGVNTEYTVSSESGMTHIYGNFDGISNGDIYVSVTIKGETSTYEAFPIREKGSMQTKATDSKRYYSLYIPTCEHISEIKVFEK